MCRAATSARAWNVIPSGPCSWARRAVCSGRAATASEPGPSNPFALDGIDQRRLCCRYRFHELAPRLSFRRDICLTHHIGVELPAADRAYLLTDLAATIDRWRAWDRPLPDWVVELDTRFLSN